MDGRHVAFELRLSLDSPALLGGRLGAGGVAETWVLNDDNAPEAVRAVLPGSSLRGVLRHASRRFAAARGVDCARQTDGRNACGCPTCELFGSPAAPGRLRVRTGGAAGARLVDVARVAIDRRRGTAAAGALWTSRQVLADFDVRLELGAPTDGHGGPDRAAEHLVSLLGWLEAVGLAIGRSKSTSGRARVRVREAPTPRAPAVVPAKSAAQRWRLHLTALEPLRLGSLRDRPFFQQGTAFVPAPTLVGAIGWGLARAGRPDLAEAAFDAGQVWVSEAWPPGIHGYHWRASTRQCERCGKRADVAVEQTAAALADLDSRERCAQCGADDMHARFRRVERHGAPLLVSGHTSIDAASGRAASGLLYQQQLCEPGSAFVADLLAPEWAVDAVRSLGTLAVGGARGRGLGAASVEVVPAGDATPVEARVGALRDHLGEELTADDGDAGVAIVDVVTSAHLPGGLEALLRERNCRLVTGEADLDLLGGWDESRGRTRALREVLTRGSWFAARGPVGALASLEGIVAPDPDWCPLWLQVRDPAHGTEPEPT